MIVIKSQIRVLILEKDVPDVVHLDDVRQNCGRLPVPGRSVRTPEASVPGEGYTAPCPKM
jgi:hypothetical protein